MFSNHMHLNNRLYFCTSPGRAVDCAAVMTTYNNKMLWQYYDTPGFTRNITVLLCRTFTTPYYGFFMTHYCFFITHYGFVITHYCLNMTHYDIMVSLLPTMVLL